MREFVHRGECEQLTRGGGEGAECRKRLTGSSAKLAREKKEGMQADPGKRSETALINGGDTADLRSTENWVPVCGSVRLLPCVAQRNKVSLGLHS